MISSDITRARMLAVLQMLIKESSAEKPLNMNRMLEILEKQGIQSERKAVGRDITFLRQAGYDIIFTRTPHPGYYLLHRRLETAEVCMLIDAVEAAPFLTEAMASHLTEKLKGMLNSKEQNEIEQQVYYDSAHKLQNDEIKETITVLHQAISRKRKVLLYYHHHVLCGGTVQLDQGRMFSLSPYALFWRNDHYYLAANYEKYPSVSNYRLDRMFCVKMLEETSRPFTEITPYSDRFDTADYLRHEFQMFGGREEQLLLRCDNHFLDVLVDRFGTELEILECERETFKAHVTVCISEGLYDWILQCGARVTVISPTYVRDEIRRRLQELYHVYRIPEECAEEQELPE